MASGRPEGGTLIIAALLVLALGFAGYWIIQYAQTGGRPSGILPWFAWGAVAIVIVGLAVSFLRGAAKRP